MRVLITGAAGFIGTALQRALIARGSLADAGGTPRRIEELVLADRADVPLAGDAPCRRRVLRGDLAEPGFAAQLAALAPDSVFHLAASLTLEAEADEPRAYRLHVEALRELIAGFGKPPRLVLASSIAVFGGDLPATVGDGLRAEPDTTYGTHKAIAELLLADYSRRGRVDARALRLPIVLIRDGAPSPAVSDRIAAIVREPLAGRDVVCGLHPDTRMPVASAQAVARALIAMHDLPAERLPHDRALNLPSLSITVAEMVAALRRVAGDEAAARVRYEPDPTLQRVVDGWPRAFTSDRASALGLHADADFDAILGAYLGADLGAYLGANLGANLGASLRGKGTA